MPLVKRERLELQSVQISRNFALLLASTQRIFHIVFKQNVTQGVIVHFNIK